MDTNISVEGTEIEKTHPIYLYCDLLAHKLKLDVETCVTIDFLKDYGAAFGHAVEIEPNEYQINVNGDHPVLLQWVTVAHEFKHIQQFQTKKWDFGVDYDKCLWEGVEITDSEYEPWEDEAYMFEDECENMLKELMKWLQ